MSIFRKFLVVSGVVVVCLLLASSTLALIGHTDTTIADFTATGSDVGNCYVGPSTSDGTDGEVTLLPTMASDFSGSSLPTGWASSTWQAGGTATVNGGQLVVNNAIAYGPSGGYPASMEFEAQFANAVYEHAGLGTSNFASPWAYFSTAGTTTDLYARTYNWPEPLTQTLLTGTWLGAWHRFRVDWTAAGVSYYIDDATVEAQTTSIGNMLPLFSDDNGADVLSVDWLRMAPYSPTSCTFTSRAFDSGSTSSTWITMTTSTYVPAGTSLSFQARAGNLNPPTDGTWAAITSTFSFTGQYFQYQASLTGTDLATPRLQRVFIETEPPTAVLLSQLDARSVGRTPWLWFIALGAVGALILAGLRVTARGSHKPS